MNEDLQQLEKIATFVIETGPDPDDLHEVQLQHHKKLWRPFKKLRQALERKAKLEKFVQLCKKYNLCGKEGGVLIDLPRYSLGISVPEEDADLFEEVLGEGK